ncbi:glycosyltransferase family 4 protein [Trichocoleus sp. FACHB-591]|uniref:glycosyltransferase family 4 protein n=1 Tax=Trichocoleus sp. FACHB-591 TaxID=2692872 RepID=UPI0016828BDD|nr:glycosyltransferase family 4 protein [Trichocoleus sp. FACHB-591]MBD2093912.1 glycosyltransferase family 4 protein [Trichocoleus sp. FACHB-591]
MRIFIYSPLFYPSVGGLETVVLILANEFVKQGHSVKLVSQTSAIDQDAFPFEVIRQPSPIQLIQIMHWSEIYFQPNVSLKGIWPLLVCSRPLVISHNNWYLRANGYFGWQDYLKQVVTKFATNISVSYAVASHILSQSSVIPNPYEEDIFYEKLDISRCRELVFLGRLVSDKGVDLLLNALNEIKVLGLTPTLTIIGQGPQEPKLRSQVKKLCLNEQVSFVGIKVGEELAQLLSAHQILVIPSRWQEPFGVVALEGIACGCVVVGSEGGGLNDAIGPCGITFSNGDVKSLAKILTDFLSHPSKLSKYRASAKQHLARHQKAEVAKAYLKVFERALQ